MLHHDATYMLRRTSHVATVLRRCTGATVLRSVGLDLSATSDASPIGKCDEFVLRSFKDGAKVRPAACLGEPMLALRRISRASAPPFSSQRGLMSRGRILVLAEGCRYRHLLRPSLW